jgi:hypothetical protein
MAGAEGGVRLRNPFLRRLLSGIAEAWRERSAERRAAAAARPGREPRLARSRLAAALDARLAVRAGVRLEDFLRHRLARYAAGLPVPLEALPVVIDVQGGEAVVRPKPAPRVSLARTPPEPPPPPFAEALVSREGPYAAREIRDSEAALDALDARIAAGRERIAMVSRDIADALAAGTLVARPDIVATPEQLGRPPVPSPAPSAALRGFVAALLAAEAWRFSEPILATAGVPAGAIDAAIAAEPLPVTLALVFAIGAAAAVFAFASVAFARGTEALAEATPPRRRLLLGLTSAGAALLAVGVAAAASASDRWAGLALLATVPFAAALLWRIADRLAATRGTAVAAALAWDRERAREAMERGRRLEVLERAENELRELEAERAAVRRRLQSLQRRAVDADRRAVFLARAQAGRLDRLSEGLACALELDRYLFIRLSSERTHGEIALPVRAGRLEPAMAPDRIGITG